MYHGFTHISTQDSDYLYFGLSKKKKKEYEDKYRAELNAKYANIDSADCPTLEKYASQIASDGGWSMKGKGKSKDKDRLSIRKSLLNEFKSKIDSRESACFEEKKQLLESGLMAKSDEKPSLNKGVIIGGAIVGTLILSFIAIKMFKK
jgi:hypothetical protein